MGVRGNTQNVETSSFSIAVRVFGWTFLLGLGACVQIAGITKPTLLEEGEGGGGGEGGTVATNSSSSSTGGGSGGSTSSSSSSSSSGSSSSSSGGMPCNNNGDCPNDTACINWSCTMGMCTQTPSNQGTPVNDPVDGDCKGNVCDGMGNVITVNDDSDLPPFDGNMCTTETCNNGVPMVTNDPFGSTCSSTSICNGAGQCKLNNGEPCNNNMDCATNNCTGTPKTCQP